MATLDRPVQDPHREAVRREVGWLIERSRAPRLRSMREFAEEEIIIPDGRFKGRKFSCDRQPWTRLWFGAIDAAAGRGGPDGPQRRGERRATRTEALITHHSSLITCDSTPRQHAAWNRFFLTGPTQSGKSLSGYVIPLMYHLFELGETVICGLPDLDMAADKWREDILPAIEAGRYRELLPVRGAGSRGGQSVLAVQFVNGATLRFMSGGHGGPGGGDKRRAGFTARVLVVTEVDGLDTAARASREADPMTQLEGRLLAYGSRRLVYGECTVSVEDGRIWREVHEGTGSRIALPCPHCKGWVTPEREHLLGWESAENELQAAESAAFTCPACARAWTEEERRDANAAGMLVHRGQKIESCELRVENSGGRKHARERDQFSIPNSQFSIAGASPATRTLGFRYSGINNLFLEAAEFGVEEWKAKRSEDEENAQKKLSQFFWCVPYRPKDEDRLALGVGTIAARQRPGIVRGLVPADAVCLCVGVDMGKYLAHWVAMAFTADASAHVVDYGAFDVPSAAIGVEPAMLAALRTFRDVCAAGWEKATGDSRLATGGTANSQQPTAKSSGEVVFPDAVWIDSGWQGESEDLQPVYAFCAESGQRYRPTKGYAASRYALPAKVDARVARIGERYHAARIRRSGRNLLLVDFDSDYWKSWLHKRLATPLAVAGAMTLFAAPEREHIAFAKHLTAEEQVQEFVPGKGRVIRWEKKRSANHWLDAAVIACVAGHAAGSRLIAAQQTKSPTVARPPERAGRRVNRSY